MFFSAIGLNIVAVSLQKCSISLSACFSAFIFSPDPSVYHFPLNPPPAMAGMCLCRTEGGFNSIQNQLLFKWGLFCDDLCGKDTGHSQSFLQLCIKDRLAVLPPCTHTAPPFSFAAVNSSNTAVKKKGPLIVFPDASWLFS